jgi:sugar O-acyltransferase (sialic acid O-acetyltransferase NeuD family)
MERSCMSEDIYIIGAGGFGREVADTISQLTDFRLVGFIDEWLSVGTVVNGHPVCGQISYLEKMSSKPRVVVAIGNSSVRAEIYERLSGKCNFPIIVHPKADVSPHAKIGEAVIVQANCIVAANASIGTGVIINATSGVGHDASVGDYCSIMSFCDIAGNAHLGSFCFLGSGTKVIPNTSVFSGSYACAGAVIVKNIEQASKVMGNPARVIGKPD